MQADRKNSKVHCDRSNETKGAKHANSVRESSIVSEYSWTKISNTPFPKLPNDQDTDRAPRRRPRWKHNYIDAMYSRQHHIRYKKREWSVIRECKRNEKEWNTCFLSNRNKIHADQQKFNCNDIELFALFGMRGSMLFTLLLSLLFHDVLHNHNLVEVFRYFVFFFVRRRNIIVELQTTHEQTTLVWILHLIWIEMNIFCIGLLVAIFRQLLGIIQRNSNSLISCS